MPAYNEEALLGSVLAAIHGALEPVRALGGTEVMVVDNASTDATAAIAAAAGARVVREPVRQIARARNAGAAAAGGAWLLFVDADSWPTPALMADVAASMRGGDVLGGGSTVRVDRLPWALAGVEWAWNRVSRALDWAAGSFLFCRAEAFRTVGGFDESLYAGEEVDLSIRLKRLARRRGQRFRVLHRHALLTSGRKARLYSAGELAGTAWRMLVHGRRFFRDRDLCYPWYDGRR